MDINSFRRYFLNIFSLNWHEYRVLVVQSMFKYIVKIISELKKINIIFGVISFIIYYLPYILNVYICFKSAWVNGDSDIHCNRFYF